MGYSYLSMLQSGIWSIWDNVWTFDTEAPNLGFHNADANDHAKQLTQPDDGVDSLIHWAGDK